MQSRVPVLAFSREQKYILIHNWDKEANTITFRRGKGSLVDYTSEPITKSVKIRNNLVIVGKISFSRSYLKKLNHVIKVPKKQTEGNDTRVAAILSLC